MPSQKAIGRLIPALLIAALSLPALAGNKDIRLGIPEAKPKPDGAIRLVTYNLLNLFDDKDDPNLSGRFEDLDSKKWPEEKQALREIFKDLDADIVALQEIESLEALTEFRDEYLKGQGYDHIVSIDVGQERGIENAVLSRFPITDSKVWPQLPLGGVHPEKYGDNKNWYAGEPIVFRRSPLRVTVEVPSDVTNGPAYELTLFVMHHKSGRYSDYWRDKEAEKTCELIEEFMKDNEDANIAVLGDFNAKASDYSVSVYSSRAKLDDVFKNKKDDPLYHTHESDRTIDFILVNDNLEHEVIEGSAFVLGTPIRFSGADWRTDPVPDGYASDHMPVAVDLIPADK